MNYGRLNMRINSVLNQFSSKSLSVKTNKDENYRTNTLTRSEASVAFTGSKFALFKTLLPKKFDHDFLPKTIDEAIAYLGKFRKLEVDNNDNFRESVTGIKVYKKIRGKKQMIHHYLFEGNLLRISDVYDQKTLKRSKAYFFRKDGIDEGTLELKRTYNKKPRFVPFNERTPKDHNILSTEYYRPDGTTDFVVKYDKFGNVIICKYYDKTGKKLIRLGLQNPSKMP